MHTLAEYMATLPRKRTGAGVLFTEFTEDDAAGDPRVLLVEPTYKDGWEVPGGTIEADESPYVAAVREVAEELGLAVTPGRLLVVDWVPPADDGRTEGLMFVFDGGSLNPARQAEIRLPSDELSSWAWCTSAEADQHLMPHVARRIAAARRALTTGQTLYLEHGVPRV